MKKALLENPTAYGAAAIFPYSDALLESGSRETRYSDPYNMFRVVGSGPNRRIWVPRHMAVPGGQDLIKEGFDCQFSSVFKPKNSEQARVVEESVQLLAQGDNFIIECPTGFGKTACAMDIIAQIGKKVIVVVTKEDLRDQWIVAAKKFLGLGPKDIGLIQGDTFQVSGRKIVIAMVQSLAKEDRYPASQFNEFGLAIWDECIAEGSRLLMGDGVTTAPFDVVAKNFLSYGKSPSVMSYNERSDRWEPRRVTHAWVSGKRPVVRVTLDGGASIRCTSDHLLKTTNRGWVPAGQLTPEDDVVLY